MLTRDFNIIINLISFNFHQSLHKDEVGIGWSTISRADSTYHKWYVTACTQKITWMCLPHHTCACVTVVKVVILFS